MRKTLVLVTLLLFLGVFSLSARPINLFGNVGFAVSGDELFKNLFLDIGAEMQLSGPIWGQVVFDYYFNPSDLEILAGANESAYSINLYGVYKHPMTDTVNLFAKAGFGYTTYEIEIFGFTGSASDFGFGGGAGIEYKIGPKMAILAGGTVRIALEEGDSFTWFKMYGGFSYQVGK
jgi:opacity protein-like surface antigen